METFFTFACAGSTVNKFPATLRLAARRATTWRQYEVLADFEEEEEEEEEVMQEVELWDEAEAEHEVEEEVDREAHSLQAEK